MIAIFLSLIGVFGGIVITGSAFVIMMTMMGIISLAGIVVNNGVSTPIETVSGGEFSRIQTAILLAIRNLLSKLGGSSINLLFLDEITGVLDDEGKEKLIEVLQTEENLNVFLISHDFTHPLIDQIQITKNNNISSIEV